ncbi:ABC transporter ATP-binding protein [Coraliomargarita parva]|uniref:ABC transporter ATP-binding protein n=1 Tax=Coraliomargarita parva TaxID=3014050 RepID=UPI0022B3D053|nr:ABC transporter ATP-binding protein [Coraliomargarita parva]
MDSDTSISVKNLTRHYGALTAIQNVSFSVKRGEVVGFLGPNGAGKSTTMRILSGIMSASSGSAYVAGLSVSQNPHEVKRKIGYMPENNPLPNDMRVVEYLRFRARLKEVPGRKLRSTVQEVMEICDLARTARRKIIGTLSKGFRQRVGIADALLGNPEVIIMDEPTIGLDPHQIQGIRRLIDSLRGKLTVVLSSHILPEIERSCDRVIIINRGRVVACGSSADLRDEFLPGTRYQIDLEGDVQTALQHLKQDGIAYELKEEQKLSDTLSRLILSTEGNGETGPRLIQSFGRSANCTLHSLALKEPNLEEIFLAATRRSWEETIDNKPTAKMIQAETAESTGTKTES